MNEYFSLGTYSRAITTNSDAAMEWFNRGLVWCYAFNQEEALRCFEKVIEIDPDCAMGYWGLAYAAGPFYNKPWEYYGDEERLQTVEYCHLQAAKAERLKHNASPVEVALIDAICVKHPVIHARDIAIMEGWMWDYADAMRVVHTNFANDLDVICLTAESLMNLTAWQLWDIHEGIPAKGAATLEAADILNSGIYYCDENALPPHPGIIHFFVHLFEMSPTPEIAETQADQLRSICHDAGHMLHMASHIDSLCGEWQAAADANDLAIIADAKYVALRGRDEFYMILVLHNLHFKIWSAMFLGQFEASMEAAVNIKTLVGDKIIPRDEKFLNATLEGYYAEYVHVLVRFGRWQEICDADMPHDRELYPVTTNYLRYAKAIAYATLGDLEKANNYREQFRRSHKQIPDWHMISNNPTNDVFAVAEKMMDGEVEYHSGDHEIGFANLREACRLSDNLAYAEPWPWMHPPRHALGALLLEQGQVNEALTHYEDDLGIGNRLPRCVQHPDNIWALHGYYECLTRLGRKAEAAKIKPRLDELVGNADVKISSSCLCRKHQS